MRRLLLNVAAIFAAQVAMGQSVSVIDAGDVRLHVFLSKPTIFQVASVVIEGENELALVDAQFSGDNAAALAEVIRGIGKPLSIIYISHSDPDYYFGLGTIADAFPTAKIVATPQTVWLIEATKEEKMKVWAPQLGKLAPNRIVIPQVLENQSFMLGETYIEVVSNKGDGEHSWLWIPSSSAILGGIRVQDNQHLWVADTPEKTDRAKWLASLETMRKMKPKIVVPAHFTPVHEAKIRVVGGRAIEFSINYLNTLERVLEETQTAAETIAKMKEIYPGLAGESNLEMSARVLNGEQAWRVTRPFPAIGRRAQVDFGGEYVFELDFSDHHTMTFRGLRLRKEGRLVSDTVSYVATEVAPGVWMVYWTESDKTHVVHIEDFKNGVVWTNIASPDGSFTNLRGTLKILE